MKFHNRELQGDFSHYESFQLNVTKNMKVSNVQKKGVWKCNITYLLIVSNNNKCLMWASTTLQTASEHIFFEKMHKHTPFSV